MLEKGSNCTISFKNSRQKSSVDVECICYLNVEARSSRVQCYPQLASEFEANLGKVKPCLQKERETVERGFSG